MGVEAITQERQCRICLIRSKAPRIYRLLSPKYRKSNTDTSHLNTDPAPPKYRQIPIPSGHHRDDAPGLRPRFSLGPGLGRSRAPMAGHNPTPSRVRGHPPTPQALPAGADPSQGTNPRTTHPHTGCSISRSQVPRDTGSRTCRNQESNAQPSKASLKMKMKT